MFKHRSNLIALRGLMLAGFLALLVGCGGSSDTTAPSDSPATASAPATVSNPASAPTLAAVPANLAATAGDAVVNLTWTASSGATGYNVKRSTTSGGPYSQLAAPTTAGYTDSSVTNGIAYHYVVSARDDAGESANSAAVSATPQAPSAPPAAPSGPPAAPIDVRATAGNAQASLTWSASTGATSYHIKRATTSGGPYAQVATPTSSPYIDTSLTNGTTYYYVLSALDSSGESTNSVQVSVIPIAPPAPPTPPPTPVSNSCGMQLGTSAVVFCDTFDAPAGIGNGNRAGDLDGNVWGVSRAIGGGVNFGQSEYNQWPATTIQKCDGSTPTVNAPADVIVCNGQLREASNDNVSGIFDFGDVTSLAMYPKQPFDFAGRTGTVSFDVSNDSQGNHSAWPEFWMSDLPVPDPFSHFGSWLSLPANGLGLRFGSVAPAGMQGDCPNSNNLSKFRWTVESAVIIRNYVEDDTLGYGTRTAMNVTLLDCVVSSSGPGNMNHVEIRISQNAIDVYATDAGVAASTTTLRHIATVTNANLSFTRGLVWLEDVHYNADKQTSMLGAPASTSQREHTFSWDNVAFDGPFTYRDFAFDASDNTLPGQDGSVNLGRFSQANQTSTWSVAGLPANPQAAAARVLFNFNGEVRANPTVLNVIVNGHAHSVPWPFPDQIIYSWRTFAVTIPLTDLVAGTNVVQLGADAAEVFSNVDIVLVNVTGGVPVLPGADDAYP